MSNYQSLRDHHPILRPPLQSDKPWTGCVEFLIRLVRAYVLDLTTYMLAQNKYLHERGRVSKLFNELGN